MTMHLFYEIILNFRYTITVSEFHVFEFREYNSIFNLNYVKQKIVWKNAIIKNGYIGSTI